MVGIITGMKKILNSKVIKRKRETSKVLVFTDTRMFLFFCNVEKIFVFIVGKCSCKRKEKNVILYLTIRLNVK